MEAGARVGTGRIRLARERDRRRSPLIDRAAVAQRRRRIHVGDRDRERHLLILGAGNVRDVKDADVTLFYILSHKDQAARDASFGAFRNDAEWQKVLKASEEKAGGSLTLKEGGVKSEYYKATDYSPIK